MTSIWVPLAQTVLVEVVNKLLSQYVENTFHYYTPTTVTQSWLDGLAAVVRDWNYITLLPHLSNKLSNDHVKCTDAFNQNGISSTVVRTSNTGGVSETTGNPGSTTLAVKKNTAFRGKSFRGRMYIPGIPISGFVSGDPNTVTPTFIAAILTDVAALISQLSAYDAGGYMAVGSRFHAGAPRSPSGVVTPVTAFTINDKVDSQRRRLAGRGT